MCVLAGVGLLAALLAGGSRERLRAALGGQERHPIAWALVLVLTATTGSLYLSEIIGFVPCLLCWYQRIAMYPLVLVFGVALVRIDSGVWRYGLPLALVGLAIAIYHVTIQWMPTLEVTTCDAGAPCTGRYVAVFGFISIPTMAGSVFLLVSALMLLLRALEQDADLEQEADPAL